MYRLLKSEGNSNITVENTSTKANIIIGKFTSRMLDAIKDAGIELPKDDREPWDFPISKELATELAKTTMIMKKPVRYQGKEIKIPGAEKLKNKEIDAMDVMLGLANYNN